MNKYPKTKRRISEVRDIPRDVLRNHPLPDLPSRSSEDYLETKFPHLSIYGQGTLQTRLRGRPTSLQHSASSKLVDHNSSSHFLPENQSESSSSSSSSWWDDDFESEVTQKVQVMLDDFDAHLFGDIERNEEGLNSNLVEECNEWKKKFPSFRVLGKKIDNLSPDENSNTNTPQKNNSLVPIDNFSLITLEESLNKYQKGNDQVNEQADGNEEDQIFALDVTTDTVLTVDHFKLLKEMILDNLVEKIWPQVLESLMHHERLQVGQRLQSPGDRFHLPPLTLPLHELFTPPNSPVQWEPRQESPGPKNELDGILMVNAKVLQNRAGSRYSTQGAHWRPQSSTASSSKNYKIDPFSGEQKNLDHLPQKPSALYPGYNYLEASLSSAFYSPDKVHKWLNDKNNAVLVKSSKSVPQFRPFSPKENRSALMNVKMNSSSQLTYKDFFLPPINWNEHASESNVLHITSANIFAHSSFQKMHDASPRQKNQTPSHLPMLMKTPARHSEGFKSLIPTRRYTMLAEEKNSRVEPR